MIHKASIGKKADRLSIRFVVWVKQVIVKRIKGIYRLDASVVQNESRLFMTY